MNWLKENWLKLKVILVKFSGWLLSTVLSKEVLAAVLAALIGAWVLITGYRANADAQRKQEISTATSQRDQERYIRKLEAYENALTQIEMLMPPATLDDIRKINSAIAILMLAAPDDVVQRIGDEVIINRENAFDRADFRQLQLILHEDIYGKSSIINSGYFPSIGF